MKRTKVSLTTKFQAKKTRGSSSDNSHGIIKHIYATKTCPYTVGRIDRAEKHCSLKQLNTCSTIPSEKILVSQLVKKFPAFYETRKFTTAFTRASHLSLFRAGLIQSTPSCPTAQKFFLKHIW